MASPISSNNSFFDSIKKAASPLIDRLKFVLSPSTKSAPTSPIRSPTKLRPHRPSKTISNSLYGKNKTLEIGRPLEKVHKVQTNIGKKKRPIMGLVKQLKEPKELKKKRVNYIDAAFNECKKEGTIQPVNIPNFKKSEKLESPIKNIPGDSMDVDIASEHTVIKETSLKNVVQKKNIYVPANVKVSKSRIKLFAPPALDDTPEFVERYPFPASPEIKEPHYENIDDAIQDLDNWTKEHKPSETFIFNK